MMYQAAFPAPHLSWNPNACRSATEMAFSLPPSLRWFADYPVSNTPVP